MPICLFVCSLSFYTPACICWLLHFCIFGYCLLLSPSLLPLVRVLCFLLSPSAAAFVCCLLVSPAVSARCPLFLSPCWSSLLRFHFPAALPAGCCCPLLLSVAVSLRTSLSPFVSVFLLQSPFSRMQFPLLPFCLLLALSLLPSPLLFLYPFLSFVFACRPAHCAFAVWVMRGAAQ